MSNCLAGLRTKLENAQDNRIEAENEFNHLKTTATDTIKHIGTIKIGIKNLYNIVMQHLGSSFVFLG